MRHRRALELFRAGKTSKEVGLVLRVSPSRAYDIYRAALAAEAGATRHLYDALTLDFPDEGIP